MRRAFFVAMLTLAATFLIGAPTGAQEFTGSVTVENYCAANPGFCGAGGSFTLSITNACRTPNGDAVLTVTDSANTGDPTNWYNVNVEGFDLGNLYNRNPDDDLFDNEAAGDRGAECEGPASYDAVIPLATLAGIAADGVIEITLTSPVSNNLRDCSGAAVSVSISYPCQQVAIAVPSLTGWGILFLSLLMLLSGLVIIYRRKRRVT
jgi:hypothetical protein